MSYSHSDVAHEFANKTGNKTTGSNVFYEQHGQFWTIYSYGHHFAIATLLPGKQHGFTALFTEQDYSNSTAKHKSIVRSAISHFEVINVPGNTDEYYNRYGDKPELSITEDQARKDIAYFEDQIFELIGKQERAHKRDYSNQIVNAVQNVQKYTELFNCKIYLSGKLRTAVYDNLERAGILSLFFDEDFQQQQAERRKKQEQRERRKLEQKIKDFKNHERDSIYGAGLTYLRLSKDQSTIETSKSISIDDFDKARRLWDKIKEAKETGRQIVVNMEIAGWDVEFINPEGILKANCHMIPFQESETIANKLNW